MARFQARFPDPAANPPTRLRFELYTRSQRSQWRTCEVRAKPLPACVRRYKPPNECKQFGHNGDCIDTMVLGGEGPSVLNRHRSIFAAAAHRCERNERSPHTLVDTRSRSTTKE